MSEKGKIWKQLLGWKQNFYEMYESFINLIFCNMFVCTVFFFYTTVYTKFCSSYVSRMRPSETRSTCMDQAPVVLCCYSTQMKSVHCFISINTLNALCFIPIFLFFSLSLCVTFCKCSNAVSGSDPVRLVWRMFTCSNLALAYFSRRERLLGHFSFSNSNSCGV